MSKTSSENRALEPRAKTDDVVYNMQRLENVKKELKAIADSTLKALASLYAMDDGQAAYEELRECVDAFYGEGYAKLEDEIGSLELRLEEQWNNSKE